MKIPVDDDVAEPAAAGAVWYSQYDQKMAASDDYAYEQLKANDKAALPGIEPPSPPPPQYAMMKPYEEIPINTHM